jgi:polysaccharide export outer membrane protein
VDLDSRTARSLLTLRRQTLFSAALGQTRADISALGAGDVLQIHIYESPPAVLFGEGNGPEGIAPSRPASLPEQVVDREGYITVPFAGRIHAAGLAPHALELEIEQRLQGKANHPQVLVQLARARSSEVTVVGEVNRSLQMQLTPRGEKLLDAIAEAGGVRQATNKTTIQITRAGNHYSMPLDQVIEDPRQNVPLEPGDVVTALYQPFSFTALGATGKNEEISFEGNGINLAQALARAGGLLDARSDPQGVFVFRFEDRDAVAWPRQPVFTTADDRVPVIYRVDLRNPASFFAMQDFAVKDRDMLYVSNAPVAELQKFLNVVFSVSYPVLTAIQATK